MGSRTDGSTRHWSCSTLADGVDVLMEQSRLAEEQEEELNKLVEDPFLIFFTNKMSTVVCTLIAVVVYAALYMFSVLILQELKAKLGEPADAVTVAYLLWVPVVYIYTTFVLHVGKQLRRENPKHQSLAQASAGAPPVEAEAATPATDLETLPVS